MELILQDKIVATVEVNGEIIISPQTSLIYENMGPEKSYLLIKDIETNKEIKIQFVKKE